jgi:hypothetical protein
MTTRLFSPALGANLYLRICTREEGRCDIAITVLFQRPFILFLFDVQIASEHEKAAASGDAAAFLS